MQNRSRTDRDGLAGRDAADAPRNTAFRGFVLHRAAWVTPVSRHPISDGGVLTQNGFIAAVGPYKSVESECPSDARRVDHGRAALTPGLVNAHTHIELSALRGRIALPQPGFAAWIGELFAQRALLDDEAVMRGFEEGRRELSAGGAALCGDITNRGIFDEPQKGSLPLRQAFLEVLGFDLEGLGAALSPSLLKGLNAAVDRSPAISLAAHSCYSTSPQLIAAAKEWCRQRRCVFSIHAAEHEEEMRFLSDGTGFCRELLESLGRWTERWTPPHGSPVEYLAQLGILDAQTLLVHAVHMSDSDWKLAAGSGCPICFCPRSNGCLSVGRADIEKAVGLGMTVALGTDSLASNTDLSIFSEGSYVMDHYPGVSPEVVWSMMTMGGAQALGREHELGAIEPGKRACLLAVPLPDALSETELIETIIHQGAKGACQWADSLMEN